MSYVLTDGRSYITYRRPGEKKKEARGKVTKTGDPRKAYLYGTAHEAAEERARLSRAAKGFHPEKAGTDMTDAKAARAVPNGSRIKPVKRQPVSLDLRRAIYRKTEGHCYLCGDFVDYDFFEVEHAVPVTAGGTYDIGNLYCSCHMCNMMKGSLALGDVLMQAGKIAKYHAREETY